MQWKVLLWDSASTIRFPGIIKLYKRFVPAELTIKLKVTGKKRFTSESLQQAVYHMHCIQKA